MKGSATYAEIKAWIKENYNLSVSNLYIAQMKDAFNLEKRENYNIGEIGHSVPTCPPDKAKAITEAFRYFGLV